MKILATDLDRTLLPNGRWPADEGAIEKFNRLAEEHDLTLVYVTGRNLRLAEDAIRDYGVQRPHFLIGDVGTTIRKQDDGGWVVDEGWADHVRQASPLWDFSNVQSALGGITGMRLQEEEHLNPFKLSWYVDHARKDGVMQEVNQRIKGKFDEVIIYSHDSVSGDGLLDLSPNSATKQTALEFVCESLGTNKGDTVFCGDSGNDVFPLTAGFSGVLVRNADEQLVTSVRAAMAEQPNLKVYFAQGDFMGLSGYYTSGVIEGAYHYGLFD